ncbi:hypothetical protein J437_LFUL017998, partial [Ladona fulva]
MTFNLISSSTKNVYKMSIFSAHDKHSNSRASISNSRDQKSSSRQVENRDVYWNNQSSSNREDGDCHDRRKHMEEPQAQDMDISPGDSTPTSETSYSHTPTSVATDHAQGTGTGGNNPPLLLAAALPRLISHPSTPTSSSSTPSSSATVATPSTSSSSASSASHPRPMGFPPPVKSVPSTNTLVTQSPQLMSQAQTGSQPPCTLVSSQQAAQRSPSTPNIVAPIPTTGSQVPGPGISMPSSTPSPPVSLANLPRLLSQITGAKGLEQSELSTQKALQTIQTLLSRQVSLDPNSVGGGGTGCYDGGGIGSAGPPVSSVSQQQQSSRLSLQPLKVDTSNSNNTMGEGPPTPTHSESQDCVDARKVNSPPSSLSSLQNLAQAGGSSLHALRPQGPHITPSLANYYRDDLVNHVRGWPADVLEK